MVERGHDIAVRSQKLGEPGVVEAVAAAPVGEHDKRMFRAAECRLGILVKIEIGEERYDKRRGGTLADRGGIEQPQRQMAAALVRVDVVEFSDPDWKRGAATLRPLRERCSGRRRQQRAGKRGDAPGARPPLHAGKKNPDEDRRTLTPHTPVLVSIGRECKPAARPSLLSCLASAAHQKSR